jgi:hypothetical protein
MAKTKGLRTLGDYRRAAKDAQFSLSLFQEGNKASHYHAIRVALKSADTLITFAHEETTPSPRYGNDSPWDFTFGGPRYSMKNFELFCAIRLMEFVNNYRDINSINDLYTNWPQRPDANISMFTYAGISYLEAVYDFVRFLGTNVARELQNAYLKRKKLKGKADEVFSVLKNTHQTDNLQICPEPDEIIRVWFDEIVKVTQRWIQVNDLSKPKLEKEFNSTFRQLEHEWNCWNKSQAKAGQVKMENKNEGEILSKIADKLLAFQKAFASGKEKSRPGECPTGERSLRLLQYYYDMLCQCASDYGMKNGDCRKALTYLDTNLPDIESERIDRWFFTKDVSIIAAPGFISELRRWSHMLRKGNNQSKEQVRKITKLTDFIINCCEDAPSISSKANRIHEFVKKDKINFMPKTVNKPKGNETKLYYEEELRQIWPKLKEKIKSLPNLKD